MNNYTFVTVENEFFFNDFFGEGKFDKNSRKHFDTIEEFLSTQESFKNICLLWHLSASGITSAELPDRIEQIKNKSFRFALKIGKSESPDVLNVAGETKWFDLLDMGSRLKEKCINGNWNVDKILELMYLWQSQEKLLEITTYILHLFLPLDIDMQALEMLEEEKRKNYLEEMYKDGIDYAQKFGILQSKIKELSKIKGIDDAQLNTLVTAAQSFFQNLIKIIKNETNPAMLLKNSWKGKDINSFHDWYCALAGCLRG